MATQKKSTRRKAPAPTAGADRLSVQQRRFVEEYCVDYNATRAAIRAGYSDLTAGQQGSRLLKTVKISEAITAQLTRLTMTAEEATRRVGELAKANFRPFLRINADGMVQLTLTGPEAEESLHFIKKIKQTRFITRTEDTEREEIKMEIELHDARAAAMNLLQAHGKLIERRDLTTNGKDLPGANIYLPDNGRDVESEEG